MQNDHDRASRAGVEGNAARSPEATRGGKYTLFVVSEIILGIAFCVAIYFYYFLK